MWWFTLAHKTILASKMFSQNRKFIFSLLRTSWRVNLNKYYNLKCCDVLRGEKIVLVLQEKLLLRSLDFKLLKLQIFGINLLWNCFPSYVKVSMKASMYVCIFYEAEDSCKGKNIKKKSDLWFLLPFKGNSFPNRIYRIKEDKKNLHRCGSSPHMIWCQCQ